MSQNKITNVFITPNISKSDILKRKNENIEEKSVKYEVKHQSETDQNYDSRISNEHKFMKMKCFVYCVLYFAIHKQFLNKNILNIYFYFCYAVF